MQYSILIVDDSEPDRYILNRLLASTGLDVCVTEVTNGKEALEYFQNAEADKKNYPNGYPPHLCFLDINMPLMNGWEFLSSYAELRLNSEAPSPAVMMFSSSSGANEQEKIKDYDFVAGYIVKGKASPDDLRELIITNATESMASRHTDQAKSI